ncbi:MAG: hypothetical protein J0L70_18405 [Leptolyngbya sp. UWPOB_LEPTO1]|uniref:NACHT domain-containing protein n=1 Tax=Leptolyngbya sp. UWPOB_LEPTO1 TaxID=2815653 RepID=UPI001AC2D462|nr:hypothetical protein [Leptolyngbya sp. UWPOB_LEPTO1]MBN8562508.1 hypothetical protein [Leptolyngbya sp. UWPOB_LEPTO1]
MASQDQNIGGDINNSEVDLTQAGRDLKQIAGDDRSTTIYQTFLQTFPQPGKKWDDRQSRILEKMQEDVIARLDFTLNDDDVLIPLQMKPYGANSSKASLKLRRKLKTEGQEEVDLDLNDAIVKVFCRKDVRKKLLILGAPGAGKTTTLLTLAQDLLAGAIDNLGSVIPIIFELSTWKTGKIEDWLVQQLRSGFNLAEDQGKDWIEKQLLLPLLDGLDELGMEQQTQCIAALNEFASGYPHLVVCCRVQEYEDAGASLRLMPGQICLQSLSETQIQQYLQEIELDSLWQAIQTSAEMRQMLQPDKDGNPGIFQVPLLLSIAAEAYDGQPFSSREELYEAYVEKRLYRETRERERQFRRDEKKQWAYVTVEAEPNWSETRRSLAWLARQLQSRDQVELLIEKMQPSWLETKRARRQYRLVFGLIFGLFFGLMIGLFFGLISGLVIGLISGLTFGLINTLSGWLLGWQVFGKDYIVTIESFQISMSVAGKAALSSLILGTISGLLGGLLFGLILWLNGDLILGMILGFVISSTFTVIYILLGWFQQDLQRRAKPNQGIWNSLHNTAWTSIFIYPFLLILLSLIPAAIHLARKQYDFNFFTVLSETVQIFLIPGVPLALILGAYLGGGLACIQHLCLRLILTHTHKIPWNLAQFLNYCTERRLLQCIGGRYRFLHRELLDYFATLQT